MKGTHWDISGETIKPDHGILVDASQDIVLKAGAKNAHILVLQGKPIDEPVAKYGPFVMNTNEELQKSMDEFRLTQFGGWPWRYPDNVHDADRGRFAKYPDGTLVEK